MVNSTDEKKIFKTSIPKLDDFLNGGLRTSSITLLWAIPGIDNSPFAYQTMVSELEKGDRCIYINQSKRSNTVLDEIENYGWNIREYKEKGDFIFLDAYSGLINAEPVETYSVENPENPKEITRLLEEILNKEDSRNTLVVYDSISTMMDHCGESAISELEEWKRIFNDKNAFGVFLFTEWPYEENFLVGLRELSDTIVELKAIEEKVILREFFVVSKIGWNGKSTEGGTAPFKISIPGGVMIYVPKILVTGPFNAGKTSVIHSLSDKAVSVERVGTTIALDHGHVDYAGFSVDLFGTPGQERFDPILELLGGEALGVIAVVDATNPDSFPRVREMLEKTKSAGLPCAVAANKIDLQGALSIDEITESLNLGSEVPIMPVTAEDISKIKDAEPAALKKEQLHDLLNALFSKMI